MGTKLKDTSNKPIFHLLARKYGKSIRAYMYSCCFSQSLDALVICISSVSASLNKTYSGLSNCSFHKFIIWPYRRVTACLTADGLFTLLHGLFGKVNYRKSNKNFLVLPSHMKTKCTHGPCITVIGCIWLFAYYLRYQMKRQGHQRKTVFLNLPEEVILLWYTKLKTTSLLTKFRHTHLNSSSM